MDVKERWETANNRAKTEEAVKNWSERREREKEQLGQTLQAVRSDLAWS